MKSLSTFTDIIPVLDSAIRANGLIVPMPDRKTAIRFRFRANSCRKAYHDLEREKWKKTPGKIIESPWDRLIITAEDNRVIITLREPIAQAFDLEGNPVDVRAKEILIDKMDEDDFAEAAARFAEGLK